MTTSEWIYNRITSDTSINAIISNKCVPNVLPKDKEPPCIIYTNVTELKNRTERQKTVDIKSIHNTQANMENLNDLVYDLFDTSTAYIKESSSNLYIDSVMILNNSIEGYDDEEHEYFKVLQVLINYHKES